MELIASERIMMQGLLAREREVEEKYLVPLRTDYALVSRMIESRLNLPAGSVGTNYSIDMEALVLVENQPVPVQSAIEGDFSEVPEKDQDVG